jgi:hypothetical protein
MEIDDNMDEVIIKKIIELKRFKIEIFDNTYMIIPYYFRDISYLVELLPEDPMISIAPSLFLRDSQRSYIISVFIEYADLLSAYCQRKPNHRINVNFRRRSGHIFRPFRSALVATLHMMRRFNSIYNPQDFKYIPRGTQIAQISIHYRLNGNTLIVGPTPVFR